MKESSPTSNVQSEEEQVDLLTGNDGDGVLDQHRALFALRGAALCMQGNHMDTRTTLRPRLQPWLSHELVWLRRLY
jgi:hypothetical protein